MEILDNSLYDAFQLIENSQLLTGKTNSNKDVNIHQITIQINLSNFSDIHKAYDIIKFIHKIDNNYNGIKKT
jgi:hypothetical protein